MPKAAYWCLTACVIATWCALEPSFADTLAKGTISGRVVSATGEPLRRATVVIEEVKYASGSRETLGDATTGDNGEFSFPNLGPARYRLEAEKSGYVAGRFPRTKALVRLTSGAIVDDITLRLVPVSVVSGYVLDGNGDPLSKAVIRLLQYRYYPGGRRLTVSREAIADERGEYRMGDLNPGRYYVVASYHSRISDVVCPPVYYPDVTSFDDALPIRLSPNDEAPIKFVLLPGKPVRVRGSIFGRGTGRVRVFLIPRGGVPYGPLLSVETSDGSFQFQSVLPGDYTVLATSQNPDELLEGRTSIVVGDHELDGVSVGLVMRMPYKRLWVSVETDRRPIWTQDLVISLQRTFASNEDSVIVAEADAATGAREISTRGGNPIDLPYPGPFVVSAEKPTPGDLYIEDADFRGTDNLIVHVNSHGGSVEGVVLDSTDQPVPGAVVVAVPNRRPNDLVDQSRATTTDQYGQFVLHGLANTRYGIYAWEDMPEGAFYDPEFLADYAGTTLGIKIDSGDHYQVKLHAASTHEE